MAPLMILRFDFQRDEVSFFFLLSHPTALSCIHHMYTLIDLGQLARYGYTYWLPLASAANVAQGGAALALSLIHI